MATSAGRLPVASAAMAGVGTETPVTMSSSDNNTSSGPEKGGKNVKGGGDPSYAPTPAEKDIDAGTGHSVPGYQRTPGIADPGVPGSKTNPVEDGREPQPAKPSITGEVAGTKGTLASENLEP